MTWAAQASPWRLPVKFTPDYATGPSQWPVRFNTHTMTVMDDPILGASRQCIRMVVTNADSAASTENPRAQLQGPANLYEGDEVWIGWATLLPVGFPAPLPYGNSWLKIMQLYGRPFGGTSPLNIGFENDSGIFGWKRDAAHGYVWACEITPQYGAWMDFAVHVKMSEDPAVGFVEIHTNMGSGWTQHDMVAAAGDTLDGQRLYTDTITAANAVGPSRTDMLNYRKVDMFETCTTYHAAHSQGASLAAVDPGSYA